MDVQVRTATDRGLRRPRNEDHLACWLPEEPEARERRGVLLLVADGMGGAQAGDVASRLAVERALATYREAGGEPLEDLREAFRAANRAVYEESLLQPGRRGMGTTLTALVLRGGEAFVAHVGDSRAYRLQGRTVRRLTEDHSLVAQLVKEGDLTPEQARLDPRRNVVTRSVGVGPEVEADVARVEGPLSAGETLLLTTDGLHGLMADEEIGQLASNPDLEEACRGLVRLARERGGPDNITVVAARLGRG
jgi:protein phosphatase